MVDVVPIDPHSSHVTENDGGDDSAGGKRVGPRPPDDDDLFEAALGGGITGPQLTELEKKGAADGHIQGKQMGIEEGRKLGSEKGMEMGAEVGRYAGIIAIWIHLSNRNPQLFNSRCLVVMERLRALISRFEMDSRNDNVLEEFQVIRAKFKVLVSMLQLSQLLTKTTELTF